MSLAAAAERGRLSDAVVRLGIRFVAHYLLRHGRKTGSVASLPAVQHA